MTQYGSGLTMDTYLYLNDPVWLRFEGLYLIMSIHTQPQGGSLAGAVGDQGAVQVTILPLSSSNSKCHINVNMKMPQALSSLLKGTF
jgi:hypothetical protein